MAVKVVNSVAQCDKCFTTLEYNRNDMKSECERDSLIDECYDECYYEYFYITCPICGEKLYIGSNKFYRGDDVE